MNKEIIVVPSLRLQAKLTSANKTREYSNYSLIKIVQYFFIKGKSLFLNFKSLNKHINTTGFCNCLG